MTDSRFVGPLSDASDIVERLKAHDQVTRGTTADARIEIQSLRAVLREISKRGCGVPGHAVAVGCGANYVASKALEGEFIEFCPDCHGRGWTHNFTDPGPEHYYDKCQTCNEVGFRPIEVTA